MARSVRKASLPAGVQEHVVYQDPRQFSGVDWRDVAELRDRVSKLEEHRDGKDQSAHGRSQLSQAILVAVITVLLTLLGQWIFEHWLEQPDASQPAVQQETPKAP